MFIYVKLYATHFFFVKAVHKWISNVCYTKLHLIFQVQERQNRVCTTVAIAIVAETCSPFTVLPALMNEYRVPELNVQNGVLKSLSFLFEYIGEMGKDYIYAVTPLLEDALMDRYVYKCCLLHLCYCYFSMLFLICICQTVMEEWGRIRTVWFYKFTSADSLFWNIWYTFTLWKGVALHIISIMRFISSRILVFSIVFHTIYIYVCYIFTVILK